MCALHRRHFVCITKIQYFVLHAESYEYMNALCDVRRDSFTFHIIPCLPEVLNKTEPR